MTDLITTFIEPLEKTGLRYLVTGSVATMAFGQPRLTNDIDVILEINPRQIQKLCEVFPENLFYLPPVDVIITECLRNLRGHLNVIALESMLKADVYICGNDSLHQWAIARPVRIQVANCIVSFAPPEYVILRKMEFFQEGGSEKHLRDIANMLGNEHSEIDHTFLLEQIKQRNLDVIWTKVSSITSNS